ncbi:chymotrypsin B-like [Garra rufa]|uniref:chymotrypsin B-like n=1 Tax=Garra rufa TaxID=137080 RepID=UPI003CCE673F
MIWIISFLALVASTLGCGVRSFTVRYPAHDAVKRSISVAEDLPNQQQKYLSKHQQQYLPENLQKQPPIHGGVSVNIDNVWPWQVSIQTSTGEHGCGGTLISKNWILTAAHCLDQSGNYSVVLGQYDRLNDKNIQVMEIAKVITHPRYNTQLELNNDIALLKLSSPVQMTSQVSPICLPSSFTFRPGTRCVTTGWGATESVSNPRFLQEATVPIVSQAQCRRVWGRNSITDAIICAGASGASSCNGDSGGPLMCKSSRLWYQVGIVSWGHEECFTDRPVVYTRVSYFQKWITETIRLN